MRTGRNQLFTGHFFFFDSLRRLSRRLVGSESADGWPPRRLVKGKKIVARDGRNSGPAEYGVGIRAGPGYWLASRRLIRSFRIGNTSHITFRQSLGFRVRAARIGIQTKILFDLLERCGPASGVGAIFTKAIGAF